jgi:ribonuclease HI
LIDIYTDGSSIGKVGPGGWAFVVVDNGKISDQSYGGQDHTTNNQMEIYAVTQALIYMHDNFPEEIPFTIWSDSEYVVKGINLYYSRWLTQINRGNKKIKNQEFWLELKNYYDLFHQVEIKWVRGHDGNKFNEIVDKLAVKGKNIIKDICYSRNE